MIFGLSVLWIMIWDTSIWRLACWNRWKIRSAQKCYPCSRYVVLPMCSGRTRSYVARPGRFELPTLCLEDKSRCAISLLFLGSAYLLHYGFACYSGVIGPKLDPILRVGSVMRTDKDSLHGFATPTCATSSDSSSSSSISMICVYLNIVNAHMVHVLPMQLVSNSRIRIGFQLLQEVLFVFGDEAGVHNFSECLKVR